jgi:hypothetical protein
MQFARYHGAGGTGWGIITDAGLVPTSALGVTVTYDQLANPAFLHRVEAAIAGSAARRSPSMRSSCSHLSRDRARSSAWG